MHTIRVLFGFNEICCARKWLEMKIITLSKINEALCRMEESPE